MKRINTLRSQLKKTGADHIEAHELNKLAQRFSNTPTLSRTQKRQMLQQIIPKQTHTVPYRTGFATAGLMAVVLALLVPNIVYSQPNDGILYSVKRGAETVRSVIQPGFEPSKPLEEDDNSHLNGSEDKRGTDESGNDNSPENNVEDKGSHNSESSGSSKSSKGQSDSSDDKDDNSGSGSSGSSGSSNPTGVDHNAARDACKAALDQRKKNGEDINSEQYKACDNL